ncbi:DMSO/selenate family reductase complex B subunit [uncultured Ferrimonas sp.]|uniref:DMSO/selenate family reductase complex B subunit n=1 Tax=uncultured Ferrimonas sp. TaxID=432640 RepID=UPI00261A44C2|nr:DMSO/selenate family reductase complex B subunit [uncultured Ferrimonas sp.]
MSSNKQYGFFVDTSKCTGCKTCQVSCKDRSDLPVGVNFRRVYEYGGGTWNKDENGVVSQNVFAYYTSISCNHCSEPACTKACPTGAMHKRREDGLVHVDKNVCIGCESCARACPYDAPQMDHAKGYMTKCDGCYDRIAQGLKPTCVESCPMRALDYDTMDNLRAKYPTAAQPDVAPLPNSNITNPNLLIAKNRLSQASGSAAGEVLNHAEV